MTDESQLASLVEKLGGVRVLAVGDLMLDRFVYGAVDRNRSDGYPRRHLYDG